MSLKNDWFKVFTEKPDAECKLFCFHYAGGGAATFHPWVKNLPENIEVFAVQLPGRENRFLENPYRDLSELIQTISTEIEKKLEKPFIFFGHSMGALISFELTRFLMENINKTPEYLFVSGRPSPHLPRKIPPIHHLPEAQFIEEIRKFEGMPEEILNDAELRSLFFPTLRADLEMCEKYVFQERKKLNVPIKVYGGKSDHGTGLTDLLAWDYVTDSFSGVDVFEGGHFYFRNSKDKFLDQFKADLEEVLKKVRLKESSAVFFSKPNL